MNNNNNTHKSVFRQIDSKSYTPEKEVLQENVYERASMITCAMLALLDDITWKVFKSGE